ncbi:glycosyltransferase [Candidatus Contubernalis alkaliaceticus]|uniref:glycosyltransferase n=1 Tax=Candidatus Contubernalis alkaliaceticus TaxID=338645 RepID=UPI001F4C4187|nr:glycosyltransferase [Candidatus Contubernalis alkalaceticus]UNC93611.1 glycosyltransferase [Candidatus Contubernalis alkalaceticus]
MNIIVIARCYPTKYNETYGIFVHEQVKALIQSGCNIKVISPTPWAPFPLNRISQKWSNYSEVPPSGVFQGVEVFYPRYMDFPKSFWKASSGIRAYFGIKSCLEKIHQDFKFELIHAHAALPAGAAGVRLASYYNVPCVVTIHGDDLQKSIHMGKGSYNEISRCLNYADSIVLVSNKLKNLTYKYFPEVIDRCLVIPNGFNKDQILKNNKPAANKYKNKKVMLSASNLYRPKGIDLNLLAVSQLIHEFPDLFYVVLGDGPEKQRLYNIAKKLGILKNVEFTGRVPYQKVMEYMSNCYLFVLPSWEEGFGVVYLEAMAHGKPVIACKGEGIDGVVVHQENGILVKPNDLSTLVEGIKYLLSHPDEAVKMGNLARKLVHSEYTWSLNALRNIEVYNNILKN